MMTSNSRFSWVSAAIAVFFFAFNGMTSAEHIEVQGTAVWTLKGGFTNLGSQSAPYTRSVKSSISVTEGTMTRVAQKHTNSVSVKMSAAAGLDVKVFSAKTKVEFGWTTSTMRSLVKETSTSGSHTKSKTVTIGPIVLPPGKSYYIYEKTLMFPGLRSLSTSEMQGFSTKRNHPLNEKVVLRIPIDRINFLRDIKVHVRNGKQVDGDFIGVRTGTKGDVTNMAGGDINRGFGGKFIYLQPLWTKHSAAAVGDISVRTSGSFPQWAKKRGLTDLAKGAGGDFRFLDVKHGAGFESGITEITLWEKRLYAIPHGWDGMTQDINKGRGGRFLYLVWRSIKK